MSLLSEIQAECISKDASISRLLRLCLQLAARLKHAPLKEWVLHELNGYPDGSTLPDYRVFVVRSMGYFYDRLLGEATLEVPVSVLPEEFRAAYRTARLDQPISLYESLLQGNDGESLQVPWPVGLAIKYGSKMSSMQCVRAWKELPSAALVGMIDTVKTRVLSMALEIEAEDPTAGDIPSLSTSIPEATVTQIINTNIYGGQVQNLAAGSTGVLQTAGNQVVAGDTQSLASYLTSIGVSRVDTDELLVAISADQKEGSPGIGARVAQWLGKLRVQANEVGADIAKQAVAGLAAQAVLAFLGIGS